MPKLFEMDVELLEVEPAVTRRILLPDDMALMNCGAVILGAMGWNGSHLFAFEIGDTRYDIRFEDGLDLDDSVDMQGVIARDVFAPGLEAGFQYDFGDDWWHRLKVLDHRQTVTGDRPPRCLAGENACPPDDSGGPFGFAEMREAVSDADHPDHDEFAEWLGDFDPTAFEVKKADREIRKMLKAFSA